VRDQAAGDVATRRAVEGRLRELFARWGYAEVATPTLEFLETFVQGAGPGIADRLLKLVDSGGEVLVLRPEMTVPLARFAATRLLPAGEGPLRLAYVAPVFRGQEPGSGRLREFTQAGVELIGLAGVEGDVEVIALAAEALATAGLAGASLSLGHAGFLRGVLSTLPEPAVETAKDLLYRRAFAELDRVLPDGPALSALRRLPALRGETALDRARALVATQESAEALHSLRAVLAGLDAHRLGVAVEVDLGLIRDFDYYSGVVFEAHAAGAGQPLLGGGRYDGLLARFGHPAPATGFALGVDRVVDAGAGWADGRMTVVARYAPGAYARAVEAAQRLRADGLAVVVAPIADASRLQAACALTVTQAGVSVDADGAGDASGSDASAGRAAADRVRAALGLR
jgi:ATP phosphoribosyltransferase regulatory subunit